MGNASISDAHTGSMPYMVAANGHVPDPSNKLPSFSFLIITPLFQNMNERRFYTLLIFGLVAVSEHITRDENQYHKTDARCFTHVMLHISLTSQSVPLCFEIAHNF